MVGIIEKKQGLTPEAVQGKIKVPGNLQEAFTRVVIAGMKVMFDQKSHKMMLAQLQEQGPVGQRLGEGINGLMLLLFKQSNQTIPPQVLVPAGIHLLMEAVKFLRQTKLVDVTDADIGSGMEIFVTLLLKKFGASPEKMSQLFDQYSAKGTPQAPTQAPAQPQQPQPQGV